MVLKCFTWWSLSTVLHVSVSAGWLFKHDAVPLSSLTLPVPSRTDCKKTLCLVNCLYENKSFSFLGAYPSDSKPCPSHLQDGVSSPVDKCGGQRVFSPEEHRAIGGAIERLGIQLLRNLPVGPQQPNIILSPVSLAFALAQLTLGKVTFPHKVQSRTHIYRAVCIPWCIFLQHSSSLETVCLVWIVLLGARNKTEKLLLKSLHAHSLPCYHYLLGSLAPHSRNTSLDVAARMYLRPGVQWLELN